MSVTNDIPLSGFSRFGSGYILFIKGDHVVRIKFKNFLPFISCHLALSSIHSLLLYWTFFVRFLLFLSASSYVLVSK